MGPTFVREPPTVPAPMDRSPPGQLEGVGQFGGLGQGDAQGVGGGVIGDAEQVSDLGDGHWTLMSLPGATLSTDEEPDWIGLL